MTRTLMDHLWQSTWFALAAAILTLVLHNNGAHLRFRIWLAASVKFLVPFSLLVLLGNRLGQHWHAQTPPALAVAPDLSRLLEQLVQPGAAMAPDVAKSSLSDTLLAWHGNGWMWAGAIWAVGFVVLMARRSFQWLALRAVVKASLPLDIGAPIPVREASTVLEPGIVGIVAPVLLLPAGIGKHLAAEQLQTILAHELCHWQRKDNLTAALHMLVEALFWFHPLVWWLGSRMLIERERAVDEAVVQAGGDRETYAEGILKVCRLYFEPPPGCVAAVSGGTLRKRIEDIMTGTVLAQLHVAKKSLLIAAGIGAIAAPVAVGVAGAAYAGVQPPGVPPQQETRGDSGSAPRPVDGTAPDMRHYTSSEWNFSLDIPKRWNSFPPVPTNSPNEVIRFESQEGGTHLLIIFRLPHDPQVSLEQQAAGAQQHLAQNGFFNFVTREIMIGSKHAVSLDFDRPMQGGGTWSCRSYFISDGTLLYVLGFGTSKREAMFDVYDRMAQSFVSEGSAG